MPTLDYNESFKIHFWERISRNKSINNQCWEWQYGLNHGYGRLRHNRKLKYSHQVAWELTYGEIPSGLCVLHQCDNRACCNPNHLFLGTKLDNAQDMVAKGRQCKGINKHSNKLSPSQVIEIRARYATGTISMRALSKDYPVSYPTIRDIVNRSKWRHI